MSLSRIGRADERRLTETNKLRLSKESVEDRRPKDAKEVVAIFKSSYSEEVYDRKAREVSKFLESRGNGFSYNELKEVTQITVGGFLPVFRVVRPLKRLHKRDERAVHDDTEESKAGFQKSAHF